MVKGIKEAKERAKADGINLSLTGFNYLVTANLFMEFTRFLTENDGALFDYMPNYDIGVIYSGIDDLSNYAEFLKEIGIEFMR